MTPFVTNIDYNEKGQRARIDYGNGSSTVYKYDPDTFRLIGLVTARNTDPEPFWEDKTKINLPPFADFLIATEAELNKVSWTTRKKLYQDTIVVLATVALMAGFLFTMDWTWKVVLSWRPIGVLHIPVEQSDTETKIDQKKW